MKYMTRNKKILSSLIITVSVIAVGFLIYYLVFYDYEPTGPVGGVGVQGIVVDVSPSAKVITVFDSTENKEIYLVLTADTKFFDEDRLPVNLSYFQIGFIVEAIGEMTNENSLIPSEVYVTKAINEEISWVGAEWLVANCRVESVGQTHARAVTVVLKNGDRLKTTEPNLDDIVNTARAAEEKCGEIPIATE
jgi:hypothetical protein